MLVGRMIHPVNSYNEIEKKAKICRSVDITNLVIAVGPTSGLFLYSKDRGVVGVTSVYSIHTMTIKVRWLYFRFSFL